MTKTQVYDVHFYREDGEDVLQVIPYQLQVDPQGYFVNNYDVDTGHLILRLPMHDKRYRDAIGYILDVHNWYEMREYWDVDEWNTTDYLRVGDTPPVIKRWLDKLPIYEITIPVKERR